MIRGKGPWFYRSKCHHEATEDKEEGKPDRVAGSERVGFEDGGVGSAGGNVAGGLCAGGEFFDAMRDIFAIFRPWVSAKREQRAGVVFALVFEAVENAVAVFDG